MASYDDTTLSRGTAREPPQGKEREARNNPGYRMNLRVPSSILVRNENRKVAAPRNRRSRDAPHV